MLCADSNEQQQKNLLLLHLPYLQNSCKYFKHDRVLESKSVMIFFFPQS